MASPKINNTFILTVFKFPKTTREVFNYLSGFKAKFAIGFLNINFVFEKFCDVKFILNYHLLDIFVIDKSKLDNGIDDEDFISVYYNFYRRDRKRLERLERGEIMIYFKKNIVTTLIKSDSRFEIVELLFETTKTQKVALLACFRPQLHSESFFDTLLKKKKPILWALLMTLSYLNYDFFLDKTPLYDFFDSLGFNNLINKSTRLNSIIFLQQFDFDFLTTRRLFISH